jgi:hypothetical protein
MRLARSSYLFAAAPIWLVMALLSPSAAAGATPTLELRDGAKAVLSLENAKPGSETTGCVPLTYGGSEPAPVRLYGKTSGTGFDRYLDLTVTRRASCQALERSALVYRGTLEDFPDRLQTAIEETWAPNETHAYRFEISVRDDNAAQGLTARQTFTWAAKGNLDTPVGDKTEEADATPLARPPGMNGLGELLRRIGRVAAEVGRRSAFPTSLLMLVLGFLSLQNRIDRRDPKLALAPVYPTPELSFDAPPETEGDSK